ncbi:MAG: PHP domain-containing protein, partial [Sphingomonadaceae bacterium]|nr:PHP domain-containing protein [Sphingomonadaceae bacterium]
MSHAGFVHLRVQSAYSMLEGAMSPKTIAATCRAMDLPAVALADRNNLFGAMEFGSACREAGVQPIIGVLLAIERPGSRGLGGRFTCDWLVLLVQDKTGYDNLIALVSD